MRDKALINNETGVIENIIVIDKTMSQEDFGRTRAKADRDTKTPIKTRKAARGEPEATPAPPVDLTGVFVVPGGYRLEDPNGWQIGEVWSQIPPMAALNPEDVDEDGNPIEVVEDAD
jgi:hypothetical protein